MKERGLQLTKIANPRGAAIAFDQIFVDSEDIGERQIVRHLANF
jgi:hypothetical protein